MPGSAVSRRRAASVGAAASRPAGRVRASRASVPDRRGERPHRSATAGLRRRKIGRRRRDAKAVAALADRGQHLPLDAGRLDRRQELARQRPHERLGEAAAARGPKRRAAAHERPEQLVTLGHPQERRVVDVEAEREPQPVERRLRIGRLDSRAEGAVVALPHPRAAVAGVGQEGDVEHAAGHAAGRVAAADRVGQPVGTRRRELELVTCARSRGGRRPRRPPGRWRPPATRGRPWLPGRPTCATAGWRATSFSTRPSRSA